ncbi:MAG TPA: hypothetical protein PKX00_05715 [Opitutaceae bacterium]|nr:hypothetical protein [Opitutaceae bacterium]
MDKSNVSTPAMPTSGIYVHGVIVSNRAKAFNRKDGSGISVVVDHEIALQPGVAVWQRFFDPKKDSGVKLEGDSVVEFPRLKEFQHVRIRASKIRTDEHTGQIVIKGGELLV